MKCGHVNTAVVQGTKEPCCPICGCFRVEKEITEPTEGLEGRIAECCYCSHTEDSSWSLPFFKYQPDKEKDEFYCGCHGWG